PAHNDGIGPFEQLPKCRGHPPEVVAHLAVLVGIEARRGEVLTDPRAVGVDDLAEQQLGADREDVNAHVARSRTDRPGTRCGPLPGARPARATARWAHRGPATPRSQPPGTARWPSTCRGDAPATRCPGDWRPTGRPTPRARARRRARRAATGTRR